MIIKTANFGRGVGEWKFRRAIRRVFLRHRGITGIQELDEADEPDEHRITKAMLRGSYRFLGWRTHVPIAVPRGRWRVKRSNVHPASGGVPRQSPARQVVAIEVQHRIRRRLPPFMVFNVHFPRNTPVLATQRAAVARTLEVLVHEAYQQGLSSLTTCDANGWDVASIHPRARRIGGRGIDWIVAVQHPNGTQFEPKGRGSHDIGIDAHDAHWTKLRLRRPKKENR